MGTEGTGSDNSNTDPNANANSGQSDSDAAKTAADDKAKAEKDASDKAHDDAQDTSGLKSALAKERKRADALEKEKRDADLAKLPELERAQAQTRQLTDENEKLTKENMRMKIAMDLGLSWTLAKRLSGDTEEELRSDGAELLKQFKGDDGKSGKDDPKNKVKTTNDAKKTGSTGGAGMNDILRALAGKG